MGVLHLCGSLVFLTLTLTLTHTTRTYSRRATHTHTVSGVCDPLEVDIIGSLNTAVCVSVGACRCAGTTRTHLHIARVDVQDLETPRGIGHTHFDLSKTRRVLQRRSERTHNGTSELRDSYNCRLISHNWHLISHNWHLISHNLRLISHSSIFCLFSSVCVRVREYILLMCA